MQYDVTLTNGSGHSVRIAQASDGSGFQPTLRIDLSHALMIVDPRKDLDDRIKGSELLCPLESRTQYAFNLLEDLDPQKISRSPLLQSLIAFRNERLTPLLNEVMQEWPESGGEEAMLVTLARNPVELQALLAQIVKKIDDELPGYFRPEKEAGVWQWLQTGGSFALEYSVGDNLTFSESEINERRLIITDFAQRQVVFDLSSRTTHVGNGVAPTPLNVLLSLCAAGTLGEPVVDLNRAALLHAANISTQNTEVAAGPDDHGSDAQKVMGSKSDFRPKYRRTDVLITGGATAIYTALIISDVLQGTVSASDFILGAGAVMTALASAAYSHLYHAERRQMNGISAEKEGTGQQLRGKGKELSLTVLKNSLIDYFATRSGGREHTMLGERGEALWKTVIPSVKKPDCSSQPTHEAMTASGTIIEAPLLDRLTVTHIADQTMATCTMSQISKLATPHLLRALHKESTCVEDTQAP